MARRRSGCITVDVGDVIDQIDDDELLDELHSRKLSPAAPGETCDMDIVRDAYEQLQRGKVLEARSILDRLLFPKWPSTKACETQLAKML